MASKKKKAAKRVLTAAQKRKYKAARKRNAIEKAKSLLVDNAESHGVSISEEHAEGVKQTISQRLHAAETDRDNARQEVNAAYAEMRERKETFEREHSEQAKVYGKEVRGLQDEISRLRGMISNLTYGGVHVRVTDKIGNGVS